jgi:hypothetical protein
MRDFISGRTIRKSNANRRAPPIDLVKNNFRILIDRLVIKKEDDGQPDEETQFRASDSVQTAFLKEVALVTLSL